MRPETCPAEKAEKSRSGEAAASRLQYFLLGPLEVIRNGQPCTPAALKRRVLLTVLLMSANEPLPAECLIDALWDCRPPRSATATLQMYVSGLRRMLDPGHGVAGLDARRHPLLRTEPSGYRLLVRPGELDVDRFGALAAFGRGHLAEGRCPEAGEAFRRALALWRGHAVADLDRSVLPAQYTVRLEEERLSVLGQRIGVDICQGRGAEVIGDLEELCARYPLREAFHEQLVQALCRADRRAEALAAYARARRIMVENVGIEPGPALRAAQLAVLEGRTPNSSGHLRCRRSPIPLRRSSHG